MPPSTESRWHSFVASARNILSLGRRHSQPLAETRTRNAYVHTVTTVTAAEGIQVQVSSESESELPLAVARPVVDSESEPEVPSDSLAPRNNPPVRVH